MSQHRRLVTAVARRRLKSEYHAKRLGGTLAGVVADAQSSLLNAFPDKPHPLDTYRLADVAAAVVWRLKMALRSRLTAGLEQLAGLTHARTAKTLTQRVRGTLPVRAVSGSRRTEQIDSSSVAEAWSDYLDDYDSWVIDPPGYDLIARLVGPAPDLLTRLVDPQAASRVVIDGVSRGKDRRQIAAELEELFDGYEAVARRVARTEGLRVATETSLAASEQIADLIPAYQVLAVLDAATRKEHRQRSGTIYYRNPRRGQLGFDRMPRPPMDRMSDGSWKVAPNCRCLVVVCFDPASEDAQTAGALVYDHQTGHVR